MSKSDKLIKKIVVLCEGGEKYTLDYFKKVDLNKISSDEYEDIVAFFRSKGNDFFVTDEYRLIYPFLNRIHKNLKNKRKEEGNKAMKQMGVWYGDVVFYDYVDPFMGVHPVEGIIVKGASAPRVKITKGNILGKKKSVNWHKGWRKIKS